MDFTVKELNNREFGTVFLGSENLALSVIENGWAKANYRRAASNEDLTEQLELEAHAIRMRLGIWCQDDDAIHASIRDLPQENLGGSDVFSQIGQGNIIDGIVDQVRNGSLVRVSMNRGVFSVVVSVAGVQAPSMNRGETGEIREEIYGPPAKHFTECRVLNRDVELELQGVDRYDNLCARVFFGHPSFEMDLGKELLKAGFAKTAEWSLVMMTSGVQELYALEKAAKDEKRNIWTNYIPSLNSSGKLTDRFSGTVVEVTSGDCLTVLDSREIVERRVHLSSVRAPRMGSRAREAEDWATEAKEFLGRLVLAKPAHVQMEYSIRIPRTESNFESDLVLMFGDVTFEDSKGRVVNVAEVVVENGFASVVKHRAHEERSCVYGRLIAAEARAKARNLNIHSGEYYVVPHLHNRSSCSRNTQQDLVENREEERHGFDDANNFDIYARQLAGLHEKLAGLHEKLAGLTFERPRVPSTDAMCVVCQERPQTSGFYHKKTSHKCACEECALKLEKRGMPCPICMEKSEGTILKYF